MHTDLAALMSLPQVWELGREEALTLRPGFLSWSCADIPQR